VKGEQKLQKKESKSSSTFSISSVLLNALLIVLVLFAVFLSYSLYSKLNVKENKTFVESKKVPAKIIQLEVLNGCGASGTAEKFTDYLRNNNFDVVQIGNYLSHDIDKSMVIDRIGNRSNAEKVADALGIDHKNIIQQMNNDYLLDVSLVIGKDFNQLKPFTN
jgi:hypothetical protein